MNSHGEYNVNFPFKHNSTRICTLSNVTDLNILKKFKKFNHPQSTFILNHLFDFRWQLQEPPNQGQNFLDFIPYWSNVIEFISKLNLQAISSNEINFSSFFLFGNSIYSIILLLFIKFILSVPHDLSHKFYDIGQPSFFLTFSLFSIFFSA